MSRSNKKSAALEDLKAQQSILCDHLFFAAAESYKLLRANLLFTIPEGGSRVIGITSALRAEGKSTTSINLAYTMAEAGKKILLIDADMRLPSIWKRMETPKAPGLSNAIIGQAKPYDCIYSSGKFPNWDIMPAGDIPPNPSELLSSALFSQLLELLQTKYDYILLDLPPVNLVSDAVTVATKIRGLVFVVRQNFSSQSAVKDAVSKLTFLESKILGFVLTDADEETTSRGIISGGSNYKKYGKYGGRYKKHYGYEYNQYEYQDHSK